GLLPLPPREREGLWPGGDRDPAAGDGEPARRPRRDPRRLRRPHGALLRIQPRHEVAHRPPRRLPRLRRRRARRDRRPHARQLELPLRRGRPPRLRRLHRVASPPAPLRQRAQHPQCARPHAPASGTASVRIRGHGRCRGTHHDHGGRRAREPPLPPRRSRRSPARARRTRHDHITPKTSPAPYRRRQAMFSLERRTLTEYLIDHRRRNPEATGELNALILQVTQACKAISRAVAHGALADVLGSRDSTNVQGEEQKKLDVLADEIFLRATHWGGELAGMVSEENEAPIPLPASDQRGKYLLAFDPLDGSSNIDVNVAVGSIFSVLRAPRPGEDATAAEFLQPGSQQVAAGYAIYGPSTMLMLSVGNGVAGFTLDPIIGEFYLTHPDIRVPETTREFAINASNSRFWEQPVRRYVDECL